MLARIVRYNRVWCISNFIWNPACSVNFRWLVSFAILTSQGYPTLFILLITKTHFSIIVFGQSSFSPFWLCYYYVLFSPNSGSKCDASSDDGIDANAAEIGVTTTAAMVSQYFSSIGSYNSGKYDMLFIVVQLYKMFYDVLQNMIYHFEFDSHMWWSPLNVLGLII